MERRTGSREVLRDGTVAKSMSGHTTRPLPSGEQFSTRSCARCAGLLVNDWCNDFDNTGLHIPMVLRCVQCGHRIDPVILENQIQPPSRKPARTAGQVYRQISPWRGTL
jgi:hypothetical protein